MYEDFKSHTNAPLGGDASMELTMAAQDDATPWDLSSLATHSNFGTHSSPLISEPQLHGRGYFSALGVVRRKPSRPDAPPTLSKSCSDKIALKQCTSLLSSIASLIIAPSNAYLTSLVLPNSQYSPAGCTRAFSASGRLKELAGKDWENGYSFNPFEIRITSREFRYSRRQIISAGDRLVPSNISASWTPNHFETLIGGVLQGRKQGDSRGASRVCRSSIWKIALKISGLANAPQAEGCLKKEKYMDLKTDGLLAERETVKENATHTSLEGWIKNTRDEEFCLGSYEQ
jgi:tRNA-specific adenosine deaminase 1